MTAHRFANTALFVLCLIAWLLVMNSDYKADDFDNQAVQERREWMQAIQHCHRTYGPQTAPEYDDQDHLICVGKKGQRHGIVKVATK